jgi:hypothetical protein
LVTILHSTHVPVRVSLFAIRVLLWRPLLADVNFRDGSSAALAVAHVRAAAAAMPWSLIESIEVGNEVDLFYENGIRNSSYDFFYYEPEFDLYQAVSNYRCVHSFSADMTNSSALRHRLSKATPAFHTHASKELCTAARVRTLIRHSRATCKSTSVCLSLFHTITTR